MTTRTFNHDLIKLFHLPWITFPNDNVHLRIKVDWRNIASAVHRGYRKYVDFVTRNSTIQLVLTIIRSNLPRINCRSHGFDIEKTLL